MTREESDQKRPAPIFHRAYTAKPSNRSESQDQRVHRVTLQTPAKACTRNALATKAGTSKTSSIANKSQLHVQVENENKGAVLSSMPIRLGRVKSTDLDEPIEHYKLPVTPDLRGADTGLGNAGNISYSVQRRATPVGPAEAAAMATSLYGSGNSLVRRKTRQELIALVGLQTTSIDGADELESRPTSRNLSSLSTNLRKPLTQSPSHKEDQGRMHTAHINPEQALQPSVDWPTAAPVIHPTALQHPTINDSWDGDQTNVDLFVSCREPYGRCVSDLTTPGTVTDKDVADRQSGLPSDALFFSVTQSKDLVTTSDESTSTCHLHQDHNERSPSVQPKN
ncbi:unnamed protein product, partial [Protopolystoma xenopodis]